MDNSLEAASCVMKHFLIAKKFPLRSSLLHSVCLLYVLFDKDRHRMISIPVFRKCCKIPTLTTQLIRQVFSMCWTLNVRIPSRTLGFLLLSLQCYFKKYNQPLGELQAQEILIVIISLLFAFFQLLPDLLLLKTFRL